MRAWVGLLRGHSAATRRLNAELLSQHGLTLNDYEVLMHLSRAPERRLRRVDLVERLLLTPSGITRLLDGLERIGLVTKATCDHDARVTYAVLTDAGYDRLIEAADTLIVDVERAFAARFSSEELLALATLLGRLTENDESPDCAPG